MSLYNFEFISFLYFLGTGVSVYSAFLMWSRRKMKGGLTLFVLLLAFTLWTFCYGMEMASTSLAADVVWSKISYFATCSAPVLFFIFSLQFTGREQTLTRSRVLLLWIIPLVSLLLVVTNEFHHLIWSAVVPNLASNQGNYIYYHGFWFWILNVYSYIVLVFATLFLVMEAMLRRKGNKQQANAILLGIPLPWIANILYISGLPPFAGFDLTPVMFSITGLLYTLNLYCNEILDVIPVARNKIFEDLQDGLIVLDQEERIADLNPAAEKMLELSAQGLIGSEIKVKVPLLAQFLNSKSSQIVIQWKPGACEWQELRVTPLQDNKGRYSGKLLILRDISNWKVAEEQLRMKSRELETLAEMDPLTNLYNRRYAEQSLEAAIANSKPGGVPLTIGEIDLDNFKGINDHFGHLRGDKVLQEVSEQFASGVRMTDIVARMGGDEFLFIFKNTYITEAIQVIERLRQKVEMHRFSGIKDPVTFSAGVIVCRTTDTADEAMRRVDKYLYRAKRAGRNRVVSEAKS